MRDAKRAPDPQATDVDELSQRVDKLTTRVEAVAGLVETLLDRVAAPVSEHAPLTAEELADVAARMVRLIESRLQIHNDRIVQVITEVVEGVPQDEIDLTDGEAKDQLALIDDHLALVGRAVLDVKQVVSASGGTFERAAAQQIAARLDEAGQRVTEQVDSLLAARMQRFEALSQSMMALVGEPVDALKQRVHELARQREPSVVLADQITALRQEGLEREALLRHLVAQLDELGHSVSPSV